MEPGTPPSWRPAFPATRPPGPLRILVVPAVLTLLAIAVDVLAWLSGPVELLWTAVFWEALLWGGVLLHLAGARLEPARGARAGANGS